MHARLVCVAVLVFCGASRSGGAAADAPVAALPGTRPLAWDGDLSLRMVDDLHAFADRELAASVERRARHWRRDFTSRAAYETSIEPNRARLAKYLGVPREPADLARVQAYEPFASEAETLRRPASPVSSVRWPARDGRWGYGFHVRPSGDRPTKLTAIVVVDPHLEPVDAQRLDFPQRLAEAGYDVYVTTVVDRLTRLSVVAAQGPNPRHTDISHREFVYRQAFEMGRTLVGYETSIVLGLFDAVAEAGPVHVFGFGDGGEAALYAAALEPNIAGVGCCASFGQRQRLWDQPLDRNVWGLLDEFGDAELAAMIVGRALLIDTGRGFAYRVPQPEAQPRRSGAPGNLTLPTEQEAVAEVLRASKLVEPLRKIKDVVGYGAGSYWNETTKQPIPFEGYFRLLESPPDPVRSERIPFAKPLAEYFAERGYLASTAAHFGERTVQQMIDHTQALLQESEYVRRDFWGRADRTSRDPQRWQATTAEYRRALYDDVLGRFDLPKPPPNARTRRIYDEPTYVGYETVLDVFAGGDDASADVWAYGILLVPKNLKPGERRPVVVCQHGLEGRPQDTIEAGDGERYYHRFAARLAERGFVTFSPQNPYIGKNHFRQLVRKLYPLKKTLWSVIVPQHEQIVDWLAGLEFVDPERIGFYGLSYGGKTAMRVPALVDRYCLSICSGDFNEWVRKCTTVRDPYSYMQTGEYEMFEFDLGHTFNYAEMAGLIAPRPFMVERGHRDGVGVDEWVSYEFAKVRLLYADLKIPERTEIEYFDGPHEIHAVGTFDFLHRHLRRAEPTAEK